MTNNSNLKNDILYNSPNGDEIDLTLFFNFFNRNKKFLSLISIVFLFFGYLFSFIPKRTWEGQFQIVLGTKSNSTKALSALSPLLDNFRGLGTSSNSLQTEVGILESPSVLMPIYKMVILKNENLLDVDNNFSTWKNKQLSLELAKGTSILNISYRDKEKNNILPVLENMSSSYQEFSGKRKKRIDNATQKFLETQIKIFRKKSANSLKLAQAYAIDKDLVYLESRKKNELLPNLTNPSYGGSGGMSLTLPDISDSDFLPQNVDIENVRVKAANKIKRIDLQLKKIENISDENFDYIGSTIPALVKGEFLDTLRMVNVELVEAKSKYSKGDSSIEILLDKKDLILKQLKETAITFLKSEKLEAEARMAAASRPKEVLLKYKELVRNAKRDELTFLKLENNLRDLELNKSMEEIPWELITKPTLLKLPVDNTRKIILAISLLGGIFLGSLYLLYKEISSGKVFELKELIRIFSEEFVEVVSLKEITLNVNKVICLKELINKKSSKKINFIKLGEIDENKIQIFKEFLIKDPQVKKEILFFNSITETKNSEISNTNFLILENASVKLSEIKTFKKYMNLFNIEFSGTIILDK